MFTTQCIITVANFRSNEIKITSIYQLRERCTYHFVYFALLLTRQGAFQ